MTIILWEPWNRQKFTQFSKFFVTQTVSQPSTMHLIACEWLTLEHEQSGISCKGLLWLSCGWWQWIGTLIKAGADSLYWLHNYLHHVGGGGVTREVNMMKTTSVGRLESRVPLGVPQLCARSCHFQLACKNGTLQVPTPLANSCSPNFFLPSWCE